MIKEKIIGYSSQGKNVDLSKDIKAFEAVAAKQIVKSEKEDKLANIFPHTDRLFIKWFDVNGKKFFTICCECECNKLLIVKNIRGLRCMNEKCNLFHSWNSWIVLREQVHRLASFQDALIAKVEQPYEKVKNTGKIVIDYRTKKVIREDKLKNHFLKTLRK